MSDTKHRILIIDDDESIHALVKARLKDESLEMYSAYTGAAGLELAAALLPDAILLDVDMPAPNGFEVCRRLKGHPRTELIPVLFLTASASLENQVGGLDIGAWDFVAKPFDPTTLRARVRAALRTKRLIAALDHRRLVDAVTGLWNRSYFDERLATETAAAGRSGRALACVMVDVDYFRSINERHGHQTGDETLRALGRVLGRACRDGEAVCRYGGDEFVVIAPGLDAAGACAWAERAREAVGNETFGRGAQFIRVTCSFGVADLVLAAGSPLIDVADRALHQAKSLGRDRVAACGAPVAASMRAAG